MAWDKGKELPSRYLTSVARLKAKANYIGKIYPSNSSLPEIIDLKNTSKYITEEFKKVYSRKKVFNMEKFDSSSLPTLCNEQRNMLDQDITIEEVHNAILNGSRHTSPGPDLLTGMLYFKMKDIIVPYLLKIFQEFHRNG